MVGGADMALGCARAVGSLASLQVQGTVEVTVPGIMKVCVAPRWLDDAESPRWIAENLHVYGLSRGQPSGGGASQLLPQPAAFDSVTACVAKAALFFNAKSDADGIVRFLVRRCRYHPRW